MSKFDQCAFSAGPAFNKATIRQAFAHAVPLKTLAIHYSAP